MSLLSMPQTIYLLSHRHFTVIQAYNPHLSRLSRCLKIVITLIYTTTTSHAVPPLRRARGPGDLRVGTRRPGPARPRLILAKSDWRPGHHSLCGKMAHFDVAPRENVCVPTQKLVERPRARGAGRNAAGEYM